MSEEGVDLLVVDDNPAELEVFVAWLEMDGRFRRIFTASDGGDAIQLARQLPDIQAVLLDQGMPDRSGLEALPILRGLLPDAKIVMFTGHRDVQGTALALGADAVYEKGTPMRFVANALADPEATEETG